MGRSKGVKSQKPKVTEKEVPKANVKVDEDTAKKVKKVKYRKLGGGSITIDGKEYQGGETFKVEEGSISKAFADLVEKV